MKSDSAKSLRFVAYGYSRVRKTQSKNCHGRSKHAAPPNAVKGDHPSDNHRE
jgi:hypothetical protein